MTPATSADELLAQFGLAGVKGHPTGNTTGEERNFVLTGLHTCGDLAATMIRVFAQSRQMVGLASVGCCYMKLSVEGEEGEGGGGRGGGERGGRGDGRERGEGGGGRTEEGRLEEGLAENRTGAPAGYPMSQFLKRGRVHQLSYAARELACHSMAAYSDRFQGELSCLSHTCITESPNTFLARSEALRLSAKYGCYTF